MRKTPAVAVLAEGDADCEVLKVLIKRILDRDNMTIKSKSYGGHSAMCNKGYRDIKTWVLNGVSRFVICHDADANAEQQVRNKVSSKIAGPSGHAALCSITVPVQEMESWMIADEMAIRAVIPSFAFCGHSSPESIKSPKEWLIDASEACNGKPLYAPSTFNRHVAKHLRLDVVARKCGSFRRFMEDLKGWGCSATELA